MAWTPSLRSVRSLAALALLGWAAAQPAHAQPSAGRHPVLHEYLAPDSREDLSQSPGSALESFPDAVHTPSGPITPPDVSRLPEASSFYQETRERDPRFRPDRDTRRPAIERYDDPFSPSLTPFKRLHAYDAVREDYTLYVYEPQPGVPYRPIGVGADADGQQHHGAERFFGDMTVQLQPGLYVRIPTVGPDARLLRATTIPNVEVSFWRDGADNWFIKGDRSVRVRLVTELAIARDTFGSPFANVSWQALPKPPPQPIAHQLPFERVARAIGISRSQLPAQVVSRMVEYFRGFRPSTEPPREHGDIYLDLALSRKGVCRHRAFAFLVTALNIGIPTRLVANEAHAWVEVNDGSLWHRIDLGGAADDLEEEPHLDRPPHVPPPDPYSWPTGRDSGEDLAHRHRAAAIRRYLGEALADPAADPDADLAPPLEPPWTDADAGAGGGAAEPPKPRPASTVSVDSMDRDIFRGYPLHIKGRVMAEEQPCVRVRVDVVLATEGSSVRHRLGSLSTDDRGVYDGAVVLPPELPVGDHELSVVTAGNGRCGPGELR